MFCWVFFSTMNQHSPYVWDKAHALKFGDLQLTLDIVDVIFFN